MKEFRLRNFACGQLIVCRNDTGGKDIYGNYCKSGRDDGKT